MGKGDSRGDAEARRNQIVETPTHVESPNRRVAAQVRVCLCSSLPVLVCPQPPFSILPFSLRRPLRWRARRRHNAWARWNRPGPAPALMAGASTRLFFCVQIGRREEGTMSLLSAAIVLFLVIDPLGNTVYFLSALAHVPVDRVRRIIAREMLIALVVLVVFLFMGRYLLQTLGISQPALSIAGGIILFLIAINMIFRNAGEALAPNMDGEPFIVPLAIPLIAGPSAMATVILLMAKRPDMWLSWLGALLLAWSVSCAILLGAPYISRLLGMRGLAALERLMGMLLTAVAVQMLVDGIQEVFREIS